MFNELEVRNAALIESLEQQTATSEILGVISRSPTDLETVLQTIAETASRVCGAADGVVLLTVGPRLRVLAHHGTIDVSVLSERALDRATVAGRAAVDRQPVHISDLQAEATEFPIGAERARQAGHRTTLAVPLLRGGMAVGSLLVRRREVRPFSDKQIELLQTFADQAVIAIENTRLFKELEARNADLTESLARQTATSEILRVISQSPTDVQPVFDTIIRSAAVLCDAVYGTAVRFDGELMHLAAGYNHTPEVNEALHQAFPMRPDQRMMVGRAILSRGVVQVEDALTDPYYAQNVARAGASGPCWRCRCCAKGGLSAGSSSTVTGPDPSRRTRSRSSRPSPIRPSSPSRTCGCSRRRRRRSSHQTAHGGHSTG